VLPPAHCAVSQWRVTRRAASLRNLAQSLQLADLVTDERLALYADFEPQQQLPQFLRQIRQSALALLAQTGEPFP